MHEIAAPLEGAPKDGQKDRLEHLLVELMLITRKYGILLRDAHETLEFVDVRNNTLIGVGLVPFTAPADDCTVTAYVPADSILDGVWLVDTDDHGPVEQHTVGHVFPERSDS